MLWTGEDTQTLQNYRDVNDVMLGICFCTNTHIMENANIISCRRLLTIIGQGGQQRVKNVKLYSQAPEDLRGSYLVFWWANFTTTTTTSTQTTCMNTATLIQKCVSWHSSASYPDIQLWTLILLTLKDLWSSIRRAAAPRGQRLPGLKEIPKSEIYKKKPKWG